MQNKKNKQKNRLLSKSILALSLIIITLSISACGTTPTDVFYFLKKDTTPTNAHIISGYYGVGLRLSNSADVLDEMYMPEHEQLSQGKNVIAVAGQKKKGYKAWLKMAAFDENEPMTKRKYLFIVDEKPKTLFAEPRTSAIYECSVVIDKQMLNKPYNDQNTKLIEILKTIREKAQKDLAEVSENSNTIQVCGGMANQALSAALAKLQNSPAEAPKLNTPNGVKFSHLSLNKGVIQMGVEYDIAIVKIKLGSLAEPLKLNFEKDIEEIEFDVW